MYNTFNYNQLVLNAIRALLGTVAAPAAPLSQQIFLSAQDSPSIVIGGVEERVTVIDTPQTQVVLS